MEKRKCDTLIIDDPVIYKRSFLFLSKDICMDMMNRNVFGIVLICLGLLLAVPFIPKIIIFFLGMYLIFLGIRVIKQNSFLDK
jgi:flagellar biosynthesis component FlhA